MITKTRLNPTLAQEFYQKAEAILVDSQGIQYQIGDIKSVHFMGLKEIKMKVDLYKVVLLKNGVRSEFIVSLDGSGNYKIMSYSDNSPKGTPTNKNPSNSLPLIGNSMGILPDFTLKGNGGLNKSMVEGIFPELMKIVLNNSDDSCTNINKVSYFVDPLGKITAFMLSCAESRGFTVY